MNVFRKFIEDSAESYTQPVTSYDPIGTDDDTEEIYDTPTGRDIKIITKGTKDRRTELIPKARHYVRLGTIKFGFVDDVMETLESGFYQPFYDDYNNVAYVEKKSPITPHLYELPNDVFKTIMNDITHFWESEERYKAFGNVFKRNILLYSIPGNGKTSLINMLANKLIESYNGLVITINSLADLRSYTKVMAKIRQVEPSRKIITIIEDFDGLMAHDKSAETLLLQILDGNSQLDNIVTIATTNHPEELKESFTNRPSRFNLVLEFKKPDENVRRFYFTQKLKDSGYDVESEEYKEKIERYVKETDGYTLDFVKEFIESIYVLEYTEEEVIARLKEAFNKGGQYNVTEKNKKTIGF